MIELERIYGILTSFLGESKQGGYDSSTTQYQFNCPYCAEEKGYVDNKYNLEISFEILKFHCWSDNIAGSLSKIIKRYGGRKLLKEYYELVKSLKSSKLYEFADDWAVPVDREPLKLPKTYRKLKLTFKNPADKRAIEYAKKRGIDQWTINKFRIGYTTWDEEDKSWANRIIIPSYDDFGHLNYFVGRDYVPEKPDSTFKRIKYKNCDADKKEIVFQESLIDWDADIYVCEGTLDCLMVPNGLSLLGKTLQKDSETYKSLYERANASIVICLDADTKIEETKKIYTLLDVGRLRGKIKYIRLGETGIEGKDFSEIFEKNGISGIVKTLRCAKKFDEAELIF